MGRDWIPTREICMQNEHLNPKTTLRDANDSFPFDFQVQWTRYLPRTPYAPQVDLLYFFLDVVYIFQCDPQRNN